MSRTWDATVALLAHHRGAILGITLLGIAVPTAVSAIAGLYRPIADPGQASIIGVISIVATIAAIAGQLALTVLALRQDDVVGGVAPTHQGVVAGALRALPRMLLAVVVLALAALVLAAPAIVILVASGVDLTSFAGGGTPGAAPAMPPAAALGLFAYFLLLAPIAIFLAARMVLIGPVVVAERRHAGAIGRSWRLTSGLSFKLIGVLLLYAVIALVMLSAVRFVLGSVLQLAFGDGEPVNGARIATELLVALVSAALTMLSTLFVTMLYRARIVAIPAENGGEAIPAQ